MPIVISLEESEILAPACRKGLEEGRVEGREEGRQEGEREVLLLLIERRFGSLPKWAVDRIQQGGEQQMDVCSERLLCGVAG